VDETTAPPGVISSRNVGQPALVGLVTHVVVEEQKHWPKMRAQLQVVVQDCVVGVHVPSPTRCTMILLYEKRFATPETVADSDGEGDEDDERLSLIVADSVEAAVSETEAVAVSDTRFSAATSVSILARVIRRAVAGRGIQGGRSSKPGFGHRE